MAVKLTAPRALAAGVFAALGASICCVLPLVLVSIGIGGAWISTLTAVEPLRPLFVVATAACFVVAYRRLYRPPESRLGDTCSVSPVQRRQRVLFWTALAIVVPMVGFPWYAELFY